jgi:AraC-like DNA-binding protein
MGYLLLHRFVWKRNSELTSIHRQNKIIRNWTIFLYAGFIAMLLKAYVGFSLNHFVYNDGSESNLLWLGALLWMTLFIKLITTPDILYGFNIFNKIDEKTGAQHLALLEIWSVDTPILPVENDRDKKLREKVAPQLNNYLHRIENKLLFSDVLKNPEFGYEELSAETGIPSSHLNFIFRYHSRDSFNDCKKLLRIREAVRMMEDESHQSLTYEAIAEHVGFTSYTTFYNSFKNIMGITPLEFKSKVNVKSE